MNPKFRGGGSSQDTDEVVISGGGDGVQTNETQTDETLPEVQNKEANQASEEMQKGEESLELLSVGRGSLSGDISSIVKMRLNDLCLKKDGEDTKYIIKGGKPVPQTEPDSLSELKVGETLHLDYFWDIIYDKDPEKNQIQHIKKGNYFQVELPDYRFFNNFDMLYKEVSVTKEDGTTFRFGKYNIEKIGEKRYLRLTMTETDEHYQSNIVASVTGGHPQLTFKVRKVSGEQTIHIPGTNNNVTAEIQINITEEQPPSGGGGNTNPTIPGEGEGGYPKPNYPPLGPIAKESAQIGKDRIRWWLHVNRKQAYNMFSEDFNLTTLGKRNLVVTDDIGTMMSTNNNAKFTLEPDSVRIYLDMLKPIIKEGKVDGFSHDPTFTYTIYNKKGTNELKGYFQDRIKTDDNKLEVDFGEMPNFDNTYILAFKNNDSLEKHIDDAQKAGRMTANQANIMKKVYGNPKMPIMHYTIEFDTVFTGMKKDDIAENTATLKEGETEKKVIWEQKINEVYLEDNPVTRTPKVDIVINKKWQDASGKAMAAPVDDISVQLLRDGQPYGDSVKIGKNNNWTYTFKKLPGYKSQGVLYKYTVKEVTKVEGYDFEIKEADTGSTITFTITNKQLPPTVPPTTPPTPPSNPYIPPYIPPTPDIIIPPTPTPLTPPDIPDEEIILPDEDVIIDDDDVVKTDFDEEDEVIEDDVPLANIPKTGAFHSLLPLVGISLLSLIMLFKFRPKK